VGSYVGHRSVVAAAQSGARVPRRWADAVGCQRDGAPAEAEARSLAYDPTTATLSVCHANRPRPRSACVDLIARGTGRPRAGGLTHIIQAALGLAGLPGPDVGEPARRLERPVVIGPAAGAALTVDRGPGVNAGRTLAGERQLDVGVEDLGARSRSPSSERGWSARRASPGIVSSLCRFGHQRLQGAAGTTTWLGRKR
jgi:hypothetical protein